MNPLKRLISELAQPAREHGRIVQTTGTTVSVMTSKGVVIVARQFPDTYSVGDEVRMSNGEIVGKLRNISSLPQFEV